MKRTLLSSWQRSFLTGLVVALPAIISIAAVMWLFKTVSNLTDVLLFFLPKSLTHGDDGQGPVLWYWSLVALVLACLLITLLGLLARYYVGKRIIGWFDQTMLRLPLLNKFYGTVQQINQAFSGSKNSFKTVVLAEFPGAGSYSVGFLTNEDQGRLTPKSGQRLIGVFIPTTPNPISGFLILVPEDKVTRLDMSVADGIKYIVSLGALTPEAPVPPPSRHD